MSPQGEGFTQIYNKLQLLPGQPLPPLSSSSQRGVPGTGGGWQRIGEMERMERRRRGRREKAVPMLETQR
jgi:hypothetical protein